MSFSEKISPDLKRQILEQRAQALIVEGYQNELARDQFIAIGDTESAGQHDENISIILNALAVVEEQIAMLD